MLGFIFMTTATRHEQHCHYNYCGCLHNSNASHVPTFSALTGSIIANRPAAEKVRHDGLVGCRILSCSTALKPVSFHMYPFRFNKKRFPLRHKKSLPFSFSMAIISLNHSGRALGGKSSILGNRLFRLWRALPSRFPSFPQIIRPSNARLQANLASGLREQG